jgi:hypothetical protein
MTLQEIQDGSVALKSSRHLKLPAPIGALTFATASEAKQRAVLVALLTWVSADPKAC